jgi:transposase InsO family protein
LKPKRPPSDALGRDSAALSDLMTRATDWYEDLGDTPPSVGGDQRGGAAISGGPGGVGRTTVTDVAERFGVCRQTVHEWLARYRDDGLAGLADRSSRPRPAEVLFDRICRHNGVEHLLTKPRSPTTIGKVERWHQTIQREFLDEQPHSRRWPPRRPRSTRRSDARSAARTRGRRRTRPYSPRRAATRPRGPPAMGQRDRRGAIAMG